jgi:hypothetical protein
LRLFQLSEIYPSYLPVLAQSAGTALDYKRQLDFLLHDRFAACQHLLPILDRDVDAFLAISNLLPMQRGWAKMKGMPENVTAMEIVAAQIEDHQTEVLYCTQGARFQSDFVKRLPASVRHRIVWHASPFERLDLSAYDRVVCNFPSLLSAYAARDWKAAEFYPAVDPVMKEYASNTVRDIDILFVGGYSRHHGKRSKILEAVASLAATYNVTFCLDQSKMTRLAESPVGWIGPLRKHRRPIAIRRITQKPVFGRQYYHMVSRAKIVLNGAIDMSGQDRGNLRCWETMGCGAMLLSDEGRYPPGMESGRNMLTYKSAEDVISTITKVLSDPGKQDRTAKAGTEMVQQRYSKENQWQSFLSLLN